jgi:hypothetical protein
MIANVQSEEEKHVRISKHALGKTKASLYEKLVYV